MDSHGLYQRPGNRSGMRLLDPGGAGNRSSALKSLARKLKVAFPVLIAVLFVFAPPSGGQTRTLNLGGVLVSVSDSRTAQVFHIVDQMSQWDEGVHHEYVRWATRTLALSQEDQQLLQKHAELRRARGWGNGFEQTFYVAYSIEEAAQRGVDEQLISPEEAASEKTILLHFLPILSGFLDAKAPQVAGFRARLEAEGRKIAPVVRKLVRFSETKGIVRVPLFLVPNPEEGSGWGGYNGGRLVVVIQKEPDPLPILFHESLHALLWQHQETIKAAAESVGLSWDELNEGIAHAFSPGLTDNPQQSDTLSERLAKNFQRNISASEGYAQSKKYIVALIIRPLLRWALNHHETFSRFLPKAIKELQGFKWLQPAGKPANSPPASSARSENIQVFWTHRDQQETKTAQAREVSTYDWS